MIDKVKILCDLMRFKAVTADVENVNKATDYVHEFLEKKGVFCCLEELNGRKILYASTFPGKEQDIFLNAHLDVVPAPDRLFTPRTEGDNLYGRGVHDDQSAAVCIMELLCDNLNRRSLGAVFSTDEEIGGFTTGHMMKLGYKGRRMAIVVDGEPCQVVSAEKGMISVRLTATGPSGHSSTPWAFSNPLDQLIDSYRALRDSWDHPTEEDNWKPSMALTVTQAGGPHNQIPPTASMIINFRFPRTEDQAVIYSRIQKYFHLEPEILEDCPPVYSDEDSPELQLLLRKLQETFPDQHPAFVKMHGATDARYMCGMGVPIAITGMIGGGCHSDDEWLDLPQMERFNRMLQEMIAEMLS